MQVLGNLGSHFVNENDGRTLIKRDWIEFKHSSLNTAPKTNANDRCTFHYCTTVESKASAVKLFKIIAYSR